MSEIKEDFIMVPIVTTDTLTDNSHEKFKPVYLMDNGFIDEEIKPTKETCSMCYKTLKQAHDWYSYDSHGYKFYFCGFSCLKEFSVQCRECISATMNL
jgi:YHS domain-containing protein